MHWETCGNPAGVPLVFLHGGPGGGCLPHHRRFYDPAFWRIVLYDQRGAGRSTPTASLVDNTTQHLVADLERLREELRVERWLVFGGSWGSTLALAYAQAHPDRVLGLVLRGIFLATAAEIDWFMHGIAQRLPRGVARVRRVPAAAERDDLLGKLLPPADRSRSGGPPARRAGVGPLRRRVLDAAAAARSAAPSSTAMRPRWPSRASRRTTSSTADSCAPNELLDGVPSIRHLPCTIVQGRYDIVCPPVTADALARAWPEAEYVVVPDAGHSVREPGITRELVAAVKRMQRSAGR